MRFPTTVLTCVLLLGLSACGGEAPSSDAADATAADADATPPAAIDWSRCRFPGLELPVPGRLFVVDGGPPDPETEAGRETIRRVDILVPGPVALLLTAPDATVWMLRPSPDTQVRAVFASGSQPQRIAGQGLGPAQLARSQAVGDDCGRYWLDGGAGPALDQATETVFGRRHDAIYGMKAGWATIGGTESGPQELPLPAAPSSQ